MFKKLKDKIAEEVKISPQRIQQFTQSVTDKLQSNGNDDNVFSIAEDDMPPTPQPITEHGFTNVSLYASSSHEPRIRRSSNSSMASDVSFLPRYEPSVSTYHLQSDLDISASEVEDNASTSSQLGHVSKEQVYSAFQKAQMRYHKYRGRYTDLANHYKELEREIAKMKAVLVETQDKAIRRTSELREQCSLSQKAKADLEQALRTEIEEKQIVISTLQDKVNLLQNNEKLVDLHDNAELESLKSKVQELKADAIVSHTKDADYKEKIANLEKTLSEFEEREKTNNLKFAKSKMELHAEIENKEGEISSVKKELEAAKRELELAEGKQGQNLKAQNAKLIEKCESLSSKCQNYESELLKIEQYKLEIAALQKERSEVKKEVMLKQESDLKLSEDFKKLEAERNALLEEIEGYKIKMHEFESGNVEKISKITKEFENKKAELESAVLQEIEGYKRKLQELGLEREQLQSSLNKSKYGFKTKTKEFEDYKRQHIEETESLKNKHKELESRLTRSVQEIEGYKTQLQLQTTSIEESKELQLQLEDYKRELEQANLKLKQSEDDGLKLQEQTKQSLISLENRIRETIQADYGKKEAEMKLDFEKKLDDLRANDEDTKQTQIKLMRSEEKVEQLGASLTQLRKELETRITAYAELESNHLGLIEENNGRQVETFELKKQLQKEIDGASALQQEIRKGSEEVVALKQDLEFKNSEIAKIALLRKELEVMSALQQEIQDKNEEIAALRLEIQHKSDAFDKVSVVKQEVEDKIKEISVLKEEISVLKRENLEKCEENQKVVAELDVKSSEVSEMKQNILLKSDECSGLLQKLNDASVIQENQLEEIELLKSKLQSEGGENSGLKQEVRGKDVIIEQMTRELKIKTEELFVLKQELMIKKEEISLFNNELEVKSNDIAKIATEKQESCDEISRLKVKIEEHSKKLKSKTEEMKKLTQKLKDISEENERLKVKLNEEEQKDSEQSILKQDNEFLRVSVNELSNRCRSLEGELSKVRADLSEAKELQGDLERRALIGEKEVSELLDQNNQKIDENMQLMTKLQSALKENESQNTHLTSLKEEFLRMSAKEERLKEVIEEHDSAREDNESLQIELAKLTEEVARLNDFKVKFDENENFAAEVTKSKEEILKLNVELNEWKSKFESQDTVLEEKSRLEKDLVELRKFEALYAEVLNDNNRLSAELKVFKDKQSELTGEINRLKEVVVNLDFYKDESSKLAEELTKIRMVLDTTSSDKQQLQDQCERLKLIQNQYNDLLNSNESSGNRLATLEAEIAKLHTRNTEISSDNQNLIKENDHLLGECMELKAKYESYDVHKVQLNEKISHLTDNNEAAKVEIEKLTEANKTLREQLNKLIENTQVAESDDLHSKVSDLHGKYAQVSLENENFKRQLAETKQLLESLTAEKKRLETQFYDLEKHSGELVHEKQLLRDEIEELKISPLNLNNTQNGNREVESLREKLAQYKSIDATNRSSIEFFENELHKMRNKNEKLNRKLDETLVTLNHCADLSSSTEIEYLKNILYNYMLGKESMVMARVLAAVCKFDSEQTDAVLKHEQHKQTLLGQLGIL